MPINGAWLQFEQGELFFECAGEGDPVVFLHGFGLDLRMWTPQFVAFQSRFRVIRYDLRGLGRSSLPAVNEYAHQDDLKALLLHLGVKTPDSSPILAWTQGSVGRHSQARA